MLPKLARAAWFIAKQWPRAGHRGCAMLDTQNGGVAGTAAGVEGGGHSAQFSFRNDTERNLTLSLVCVFLLLCLSLSVCRCLSLSVPLISIYLCLSVLCIICPKPVSCVLYPVLCPVSCVLWPVSCVLSRSRSRNRRQSRSWRRSRRRRWSRSRSRCWSRSRSWC